MARAPLAGVKIPTDSPQLSRSRAWSPRQPGRKTSVVRPTALAVGAGREATRDGGQVIELEYGITVYPARSEAGRWRAVWYEAGERQQCEAATEAKLAPKLTPPTCGALALTTVDWR
jgi:hypothetical protein